MIQDNLYNRILVNKIIYNKFGKDVGSIIQKYVIGTCSNCDTKLLNYYICESCDQIFCLNCRNTNDIYNYSQYFPDYCYHCIVCMFINDK